MEQRLKGVNVEELERAYEKSIVWFFAFPRNKIGLTKLSKYIKSSKTATRQAIEKLIQQDFLFRDVAGKAWILMANQKNHYFITKKIPYHLDKVYESRILEVVRKKLPRARAIVLFGSYRWGDDTEESDIDIAVEVLGNHKMEVVRLGVVEQLGYRKNISVNLHVFSRNKIDLNLFANIANGFVLDGFLEVKP